FGSAFVASTVAGRGETLDPSIFFVVFVPLLALVVVAWSTLNWYLSVAPVCAALDGSGAMAAFAGAVRLSRRRMATLSSVGFIFGLLRAVALVAVFMVSVAVAEAPWMSAAVQIALLVVISLAYFVVADWLYVARLAAYIEIARRDAAPEVAPIAPVEAASPRHPRLYRRQFHARVEVPVLLRLVAPGSKVKNLHTKGTEATRRAQSTSPGSWKRETGNLQLGYTRAWN